MSNDTYLFIGIAIGLFLPLFDNFVYWLSIKIFGDLDK